MNSYNLTNTIRFIIHSLAIFIDLFSWVATKQLITIMSDNEVYQTWRSDSVLQVISRQKYIYSICWFKPCDSIDPVVSMTYSRNNLINYFQFKPTQQLRYLFTIFLVFDRLVFLDLSLNNVFIDLNTTRKKSAIQLEMNPEAESSKNYDPYVSNIIRNTHILECH